MIIGCRSSHIIRAGRIDGVGLSVPDWQYHYTRIIEGRLRIITIFYNIDGNKDALLVLVIIMKTLKEAVKYYFADFVRKGGTLPPHYRQKFWQKRSYTLRG